MLQQQQNLGRRFGASKMHLSPSPPPPRWLWLLSVRSKAVVVVDSILIVTPVVGFCNNYMFCCALLYIHSSFAITLMGKRELVALLCLYACFLVIVVWSSSRCHRFFCSLWLWYFLIILTYYFWLASWLSCLLCFVVFLSLVVSWVRYLILSILDICLLT